MFAMPQFVCVPAKRPFGLFGHGHRMLPRQQALHSFAPLQTGPSVFSGTGIACHPDRRPYGICGVVTRLRPCQQVLRTFQGRISHAVFAVPKFVCVPANRSFGLFGHGHRMLPRQQALRCLRAHKSFASLQTGPSVFSARASYASPTAGSAVFALPQFVCGPSVFPCTGIACLPERGTCVICGVATRLRPCQ